MSHRQVTRIEPRIQMYVKSKGMFCTNITNPQNRTEQKTRVDPCTFHNKSPNGQLPPEHKTETQLTDHTATEGVMPRCQENMYVVPPQVVIAQGLKSPFKYIGFEDGLSPMEARYPAILFKQQLTACVEKIFGLIRDNLKKEISPLLGLCIQAPKIQRVHGGKSSRSPGGIPHQSSSSQWDSIIKFLDSLMNRLRLNHVPSFFIRKLATQVFSFINISLFNSLLLRRECCTFSNGEYVKSGLAELEKWIVNSKEEFAGTSWHELNYIRQAVGFLVIHQKRKKSLEEIRQDLCPALTVRQIYRISTMYWDDKYGTQSVSNEVVSEMREILNKDSQNLTSNSFLLDDDLSIPFSTEDIYMAIPAIDPSDIELPTVLSEYSSAQFLVQRVK